MFPNRRTVSVLAIPWLVAACLKGGKDPGDTDPTSDPETPSCTATIDAFDPANGTQEVAIDQPVTVTFTAAVGADDPWSLEVVGTEGTATLAGDGLSATFVPDGIYAPSANHQVRATVCDDERLSAFTTRFGVDPDVLPGRTYAVNYGAVTFVNPGIANGLPQPADWILVQLDTWDPAALRLTTYAGLGNGPSPEPDCANAFPSGEADFAGNPVVTVGPTDFDLPFGADTVTIEDFTLVAQFEGGPGVLADVEISGNLDTRGITTIAGVCALAALAGDQCQPCRDGVPRCLPVLAQADQADYWDSIDVKGTCGL